MTAIYRLWWSRCYPLVARLVYGLISLLPYTHHWKSWFKAVQDGGSYQVDEGFDQQRVWLFCCPSAGEYEAILPVVQLAKANINARIEVAFFSSSGYKYAISVHAPLVDRIFYMPLEKKSQLKTFFQVRQIDLIVFSTMMLWPLFLQEVIDRKIPFSFVNVQGNQGRTKQWFLTSLSHLFVKCQVICFNEKKGLGFYRDRFLTNVVATGDPRIDGILAKLENQVAIDRRFLDFSNKKKLLIFGSTHQEESELIRSVCSSIDYTKWKVVIAPHELSVVDQVASLVGDYTLYSDIDAGKEVLIVDCIGVLKYLYQHADLAYIGGGLVGKLHNIAEPLLAGCKVCIGPKYHNSLIAIQGVIENEVKVIESSDELLLYLDHVSDHDERIVPSFLETHVGAANRIFKELSQLV